MNKVTASQLIKKVKKWANTNGFESDAEDMAQYALFKVAQSRKAHVSQLCIDYVRQTYGRTGKTPSKSQAAQAIEKRFYSELSDKYKELTYSTDMEALDFEVLKKSLAAKDRAIVTLRFKWGMTDKEIGDCFGLSESRIRQNFSEIKKQLIPIILKRAN
jgi:DNA-directed RNA polymerase specialized sigma24 family protein